MQRKVVLSRIVPYNQLYVMTKWVQGLGFYWNKGSHKVELGMGPITEKPMHGLGLYSASVLLWLYMLSETQFRHDTKFYWVFFNVITVLCSVKLGYHGKKIEKKGRGTVQNGGKNMLDKTCNSITLEKFRVVGLYNLATMIRTMCE